MKVEIPYNPTMTNDPTRSHHGGNQESEKAFEAGDKDSWVERTYIALLSAGLAGATPEEVAAYWTEMLGYEVTVLSIRPRFTTLLKQDRIRKTNQTRQSLLGVASRVCVASIFNPIEYVDTRAVAESEPDQDELFKIWGGESDLSDGPAADEKDSPNT